MRSARSRRSGFALIEALIALVLILVGLIAVSQLQSTTLFGAGEGKSRSEAATIAQRQLERLTNQLQKGDYTALAGGGPLTVNGSNATYALSWGVSTPDPAFEKKLVQVSVNWTDSRGTAQSFDLNSLVSWDDPTAGGKFLSDAVNRNLISPTGDAQRGSGQIPSGAGTPNHDGTRIYTDADGKTYLADSSGDVLLFIPPKANGTPQAFTTITGRVYFDLNAGNNALPDPSDVRVRLSSEGECIFDNTTLGSASGGANSYQFFTYTCYVGPGWYGNVGVSNEDSNGSGPKICVGDPGFNSGVSNSTQTSAHPNESGVRTYRGFRSGAGTYLSMGMLGGRKYGLSYNGDGSLATGPFDGRHRPSDYGSFYGNPAAGSTNDYLNQDFLLTKSNPSTSCASKMAGGVFTRNAGKYVCISPHATTDGTETCPTVWPNFESEVGTGGQINFALAVAKAGNGAGSVTSNPAGIDCGTSCSASFATGTLVTLTANPDGGSVFAQWSGGGCSGTGPCTVTMSAGQSVTATFDPTGTGQSDYTLTVTKAGTGTGTVSAPTGINCGVTCSFDYAANTSVTLTATPTGGSVFSGWSGGACTGSGGCTVTMAGTRNVVATFAEVCTTPTVVSGSAHDKNGTVTVNPNNYGGCNMAGGNSSNYSCSFAAVPRGTLITLTNSRSAGGNSYSYNLTITANCTSQTNVDFPQ